MNFVQTIHRHPKTFLLLGGKITGRYFYETLSEYGLGDVQVHIGRQMSYEEEKSTEMPNLSIGEFKMMSDSDKKKVLKERSKALSKKDNSEDKIRHYKEKAIRNMLNVKI